MKIHINEILLKYNKLLYKMLSSLLSSLSLFFLSSFFLVIYYFSLPACTEAYSQSDEQYACHLGCQNQLPYAELRQEQV